MTFELFCMTIIALLIGMAVAFNGYRWFVILLPVWGFIFGFGLGAETMQALFGTAFLAEVSSWVVGFFAGLIFAVLSYLFYFIGVALFAGSAGYALGVGLLGLIGVDFGLVAWLVGVVVGVVVAAVTIILNIQKWVIIFFTATGGAGVIVGSLLFALGVINVADLGENAVQAALQDSIFWTIIYLVLAILGFLSQFATTQTYVLEEPANRI